MLSCQQYKYNRTCEVRAVDGRARVARADGMGATTAASCHGFVGPMPIPPMRGCRTLTCVGCGAATMPRETGRMADADGGRLAG
jgi:hypothetical protein